MTAPDEARIRAMAALRLVDAAQTGRMRCDPTVLVTGIVSLVWQALEWERGLRP